MRSVMSASCCQRTDHVPRKYIVSRGRNTQMLRFERKNYSHGRKCIVSRAKNTKADNATFREEETLKRHRLEEETIDAVGDGERLLLPGHARPPKKTHRCERGKHSNVSFRKKNTLKNQEMHRLKDTTIDAVGDGECLLLPKHRSRPEKTHRFERKTHSAHRCERGKPSNVSFRKKNTLKNQKMHRLKDTTIDAVGDGECVLLPGDPRPPRTAVGFLLPGERKSHLLTTYWSESTLSS